MSDPTPSLDHMPLTDTDHAILELERGFWLHRGAKTQAIADRFGLSEPAYYVALNALLDSEDALAFDPILVRRLRARRSHRARSRA